MRSIKAICLTGPGTVRASNEDNFYFARKVKQPEKQSEAHSRKFTLSRKPVCFGVLDGMGGLDAGEQASFAAAKSFAELLKNDSCEVSAAEQPQEYLCAALCRMGQAVSAFGEASSLHCGCVAALAAFDTDHAYIGNVGDCRIYLYRAASMRTLTKEHTDRERLRRMGSDAEPSLTQYLGMSEKQFRMSPYGTTIRLYPGDRFLLCSDGLPTAIGEDGISRVLRNYTKTDDCAGRLMKKAEEKGAEDNLTLILIDL